MPLEDAAVFVGREHELDELARLLDEACSGRLRVATLSGEPGVGKTKTAEAFAAHAGQAGARVLWGTCYAAATPRPLVPWIEAVSDAITAFDDERLVEVLGRDAAVLATIVPAIAAALPALRRPARLTPEEARLRAFDGLARLLAALAAGEPIAVVLEDVHWADQSSLELLRYVGRRLAAAPFVVVATYRESEVDLAHEVAQTLAELDRHTLVRRLALRNLTGDDLVQLAETLAQRQLPGSAIETIARETGGNPFFVTELIRALRDEGRDLADPELTELPPRVRNAVGGRLARVSPSTRRVLSVAAAFDGPFDFAELAAVAGLAEDALLECVDEALRANLFRADGAGDVFDFTHALIRHAIYDELSASRRARLHRRVADALERVYAGHEDVRAAEIAVQYARSARLPGAAHGIRYAVAAADQARDAYAYREAADLLRTARTLARETTPAVEARLVCRVAIAEAEALLLDDAEKTVHEAVAALERSGADGQTIAEFLAEAAPALKVAGAPERVLAPLVRRGLALVEDPESLTWARLKLVLNPIERRSVGGFRYARWVGFDARAAAIARGRGTEDDYVRTLSWLDLDPDEVDPLIGRITEWTTASAQIAGLNVLTLALLYVRGERGPAADLAERMLWLSEQHGSVFGQTSALLHLAEMAAYHGEFADTRLYLATARALAERLGPDHRLRAGASNADEYLLLFVGGDWQPLAEKYRRAVADPGFAMPWLAPYAAAVAAVAFTRLGAPSEAKQLLARLLPVIREDPSHPTYAGTVNWAATAAWEIEDQACASDLRRLAETLGVRRLEDGWLELSAARMAALAGDHAGALAGFARARGRLEAAGRRPLHAVAQLDEAVTLQRARQPGAEARLAAAQAEFGALGMTWYAERAKQLEAVLASRTVYPDGLTQREVEILRLLARGARNKEIADELVVSVHTVERHLANIYGKIGARNRAAATAYALSVDL